METAVELASRDVIKPIYPGQRKLDYKKLESAPIEKHIKDELLNLFGMTRYFAWEKIIELLESAIDQALDAIEGDFYVAINEDKFSSELLFTCVFWNKLKERCIGLISIEKIADPKTKHDILIIDDFSLTGTNIFGSIDQFRLDNEENNVTFYVAVAIITDWAVGLFEGNELNFFFGEEIGYINISGELGNLLQVGGSENDYENDEMIEICPFFSDHKITNVMVNTPLLYHYGKIGDVELGCLIGYPPDENLKKVIWEKYFENIMEPPKIYKYIS